MREGQSGDSTAQVPGGRMAGHVLQLSAPPLMEAKGNFPSAALGQDFGDASQLRGRE